jgi:hypothetical protein
MTSFIRTAQRQEKHEYIRTILGRTKHFIPLQGCPERARIGDFIYLAYRGEIVGRARISDIQPVDEDVPFGSTRRLYHAKWKVWYEEGWQRAPRHIPFRGYRGIRYVDKAGFQELDREIW